MAPGYYERRRDRTLFRRYGISKADAEDRLRSQGNACAICGGRLAGLGAGPDLGVVDHCHGTKLFRGVTHSGCNGALGLIKESLTAAIGLVEYIKKHCLTATNGQTTESAAG